MMAPQTCRKSASAGHCAFFRRMWRASLLARYPERVALCFTLMASQANCYNAILFTYGLILSHFYGVASGTIGW